MVDAEWARMSHIKEGLFLLEENDYPGRITEEVLVKYVSRIDSEFLELFEA